MKNYKHIIKKVSDLIPYARNSRTHSAEQILQVASSIKEFGFTNPVLIDDDNGIIAGHGRVLAAKKLNIDNVPCIVLSGMSDAQKKAYIIADNSLALNAGWDMELLKIEIDDLGDMDFDIELLGFDADFLDGLDGDELPEDDTASDDFGYEEKYAVVVECSDELDQQNIFSKLQGIGLKCKVLVN